MGMCVALPRFAHSCAALFKACWQGHRQAPAILHTAPPLVPVLFQSAVERIVRAGGERAGELGTNGLQSRSFFPLSLTPPRLPVVLKESRIRSSLGGQVAPLCCLRCAGSPCTLRVTGAPMSVRAQGE